VLRTLVTELTTFDELTTNDDSLLTDSVLTSVVDWGIVLTCDGGAVTCDAGGKAGAGDLPPEGFDGGIITGAGAADGVAAGGGTSMGGDGVARGVVAGNGEMLGIMTVAIWLPLMAG